jgi:hypothetical protein
MRKRLSHAAAATAGAAAMAVFGLAVPTAWASTSTSTSTSVPAVNGTSWESDQECGGGINPTPCYLTLNAHTDYWFASVNGATPLLRARHHCNKSGWCEEVSPNGLCMTIATNVKGGRQLIDRRCGDRTASHKLRVTQLWKITYFKADSTSAFEVYSLVHEAGCHFKGKGYQYVLTSQGNNHKVKMDPAFGSHCSLTTSQLWFPAPTH